MAIYSSNPEEVFAQLQHIDAKTGGDGDDRHRRAGGRTSGARVAKVCEAQDEGAQPPAKRSFLQKYLGVVFCLSWFAILAYLTYPTLTWAAFDLIGYDAWFEDYCGFIALTAYWLACVLGIACARTSLSRDPGKGFIALRPLLRRSVMFCTVLIGLLIAGMSLALDGSQQTRETCMTATFYVAFLGYPALTLVLLAYGTLAQKSASKKQGLQ